MHFARAFERKAFATLYFVMANKFTFFLWQFKTSESGGGGGGGEQIFYMEWHVVILIYDIISWIVVKYTPYIIVS